jgi:hypothetical protein
MDKSVIKATVGLGRAEADETAGHSKLEES